MDNLKSCPFCGGVAELKAPGYEHYSPFWCKCTQCGAEGPTKLSELEAEEGWNERTQEGGWISVEDRLPPMEKRVLVFCKSKSEHTQNVIAITEMTDVNQFNYKCKTEPYWRKPWDFFYANFDITHWMPMPEPPKEDDHETE